MKTPISYYGGKQTLLKHILPHVPKHVCYTEAFAGGAALYWAKEPSELEVLNDLNGSVVNFYKVLKCNFNALKIRIDQTLHSREEHEFAHIVYEYPRFFDEVTCAWSLWVLSKMSFASKLNGSWGYDKAKNSMAKKVANAKDAFTEELAARLERTQIEQRSGLKVIESRDTINTFHFVDPPYVGSNCGHYSGSFNLMDFQELLELLQRVDGRFMLTMFPHEMLQEFIDRNDWRVVEVNRTISASRTRRRKQSELIVMNY